MKFCRLSARVAVAMHRAAIICMISFLYASACHGQVLKSLYEEDHEYGQHPIEKEMFQAIDAIFSERDAQELDYELLMLRDYVDSIVQYVNPLADTSLTITVYIEESPIVNASMYPDGRMQINLGLLQLLDNEAELAYVICHELAHFILRHALRSQLDRDSIRSSPRITFNKRRALSRAFGEYSQGHEKEADALGVVILGDTDYSLNAALTSLDKLPMPDTIGAYPQIITSILGIQYVKTHPYNEERVMHVGQLIDQISDQRQRILNTEKYQRQTAGVSDLVLDLYRYQPYPTAQLCESLIVQLRDTTTDYYHRLQLLMADSYTKLLNNQFSAKYHTLKDMRTEDGVDTRRLTKSDKDALVAEQLQSFEQRAIDIYSSLLYDDRYKARCTKGLGLVAYYTQDYRRAKQLLQDYLVLEDAGNRRFINVLLKKCDERIE